MQMTSSKFSKRQADLKFFKQQAEKCADLARRTYDEDGRERWMHLQRTYFHLAEIEEQQARKLHAFRSEMGRKPVACR
jgi:hypothetical protein